MEGSGRKEGGQQGGLLSRKLSLSPPCLKDFTSQILSLTLRWRPKGGESCREGQDSLCTVTDLSRGEDKQIGFRYRFPFATLPWVWVLPAVV